MRTSPFYPQSNGKIERWHKTIKQESIRAHCPLYLQEARRIVDEFVVNYNTIRLHSAIGYITPQGKLMGLEKDIFAERDRKLNEARQRRAEKRKKGSCGKNSIDWKEVNE